MHPEWQLTKQAHQSTLQVAILSGVKTGCGRLIKNHSPETSNSSCWWGACVLLADSVIETFCSVHTHQLAVPWDKAREGGSLQHWNWREEPDPSTWQGDTGTQQQAAGCVVWCGGGGWGTNYSPPTSTHFTQPYATYDAVLCKEKWDTQQQEQAPLAAHSLCLDTHTPTDTQTHTHTHSKTIECSPTLTHETEQLATKKHLHYRTLVDSQVLEPTLSLECSPLTNASFHGEKLLSCAPPISPMSVQTSFEPVADTAVRSDSRQTWTELKVEQQVKGLGGLVVWEGSRVCRHR